MQQISRIIYSSLIVVAVFFNYGLDWNWDVAPVEEGVQEETANNTTGLDRSDVIVDQAGVEKTYQSVSDTTQIPSLPEVYKASKIASKSLVTPLPNLKGIRAPKGRNTVPAVPSASKIQNQLKEIIEMNDNLKKNYTQQASELHRIQTQSKIHKQILQDLMKAKGHKPVQMPQDMKELIRQKKIKLIADEARKNYDYLESLRTTQIEKEATQS